TDTGIAPDKACIFSNADRFKAIVDPEGSLVAEGTARDPGPLVCWINVLPGLSTHDIVKQYRVNTTDIAIIAQQCFDLITEPVWRVPIVIIPMGNNGALCLFAGKVTFRPQYGFCW